MTAISINRSRQFGRFPVCAASAIAMSLNYCCHDCHVSCPSTTFDHNVENLFSSVDDTIFRNNHTLADHILRCITFGGPAPFKTCEISLVSLLGSIRNRPSSERNLLRGATEYSSCLPPDQPQDSQRYRFRETKTCPEQQLKPGVDRILRKLDLGDYDVNYDVELAGPYGNPNPDVYFKTPWSIRRIFASPPWPTHRKKYCEAPTLWCSTCT